MEETRNVKKKKNARKEQCVKITVQKISRNETI
jgi:hypothetical protein